MKRFIAVLAILAMSGCARVSTAPSNAYRAAGQTDAWMIGGSGDHLTGAVTITINGQLVINDTLGLIATDKEFTGAFQGKTIVASCGYVSAGSSRPLQCMVFVNNERATTLRF